MKRLFYILIVILIAGCSSNPSPWVQEAEDRHCGTFDFELLEEDIKAGVFKDNPEFAKAVEAKIRYQLKCEEGL